MKTEKQAQILTTIEQFIVQGSMEQAHILLRPFFKKRIERKLAVKLANLARRSHLPENAVAVLHHIVRPSPHSPIHATEAEKGEYAAALNALGATREANQLLTHVDSKQFPNALLFHSYVHIWQWDWEAAIPYLERYIKLPKVDQQMRFWGMVNLAQCLMHGFKDLVQARTLLTDIATKTSGREHRNLHKNSLLALLQTHVLGRQWEQAQLTVKSLEQIENQGKDAIFALVLEQWKNLCDLYHALETGQGRDQALARLRNVRAQFKALKLWENVRSCDYYEAICFKNKKLLIQLYFGTTFPSMRQRILEALGGEEKLPLVYHWSFFRPATENSPIIDLHNGQNSISSSYLKKGQIPQRLLMTLGQDFYKPMRVSELHEHLYPGENYHPTSSPNRIHQALRRLRHWLHKSNVPLEIREEAGFYHLESAKGCVIKLTKDLPTNGVTLKLQQQFAKLKDHFKTHAFSREEVLSVLNVSSRSAIRILNQLRNHELIERIHQGPKTYYTLKPF
ncbi:MAG: hypothetical protein HYV97_17985 [Bdellovibrio sp.]|nr:hypothetical protein [Bdellovibrio sp.]